MQQAIGDPGEFENLKRMVAMFTHPLSGLIVNDALFRIAIAAGRRTAAQRFSRH